MPPGGHASSCQLSAGDSHEEPLLSGVVKCVGLVCLTWESGEEKCFSLGDTRSDAACEQHTRALPARAEPTNKTPLSGRKFVHRWIPVTVRSSSTQPRYGLGEYVHTSSGHTTRTCAIIRPSARTLALCWLSYSPKRDSLHTDTLAAYAALGGRI